jgi:hypothetical protein
MIKTTICNRADAIVPKSTLQVLPTALSIAHFAFSKSPALDALRRALECLPNAMIILQLTQFMQKHDVIGEREHVMSKIHD